MQGLGNRIKSIRLNLGETMEEFGSRFNTSKGTINNWEKERNKPNKANLKAIAEIGEVSIDELLYGSINSKISVDIEQNYNLKNYVNSKRQVIKQELDLFKKSAIEGFFSVIGLAKGLGDKGVEDYKRHEKRIKDLENFGKKYIEHYYDNYTYEKYLQAHPNSDPKEFQEYKDKEWEIFKEVLDNFWEAYDIPIIYGIDVWINNRFTNQIADQLDCISKQAVEEGKEHYYINEVVQPFLDKAAKDFKEYIKDYIDTRD